MENFSWHLPVYVVNGGVATEGHSSDLTPGKVGLFDRQNFSVATKSGSGKEFFFAQGRIGGVDWYGNKVKESHKSPFFISIPCIPTSMRNVISPACSQAYILKR